jgi:hypothetical protein
MDQTLPSSPNQSLSIEEKQLLCISNVHIWLVIHLIMTRLIDFLFLLCLINQLSMILVSLSYHYLRNLCDLMGSSWLEICHLDDYSLMIIVLKKEMKLIFIYVYIAFFYTWLDLFNSNYRITFLNLIRWFIEGSLFPQIFFFAIIEYLLGIMCFFEIYHLLYFPTILIKVLLFILMRYAESQPHFFLNQFQIFLFNTYCYWPNRENLSDKLIE